MRCAICTSRSSMASDRVGLAMFRAVIQRDLTYGDSGMGVHSIVKQLVQVFLSGASTLFQIGDKQCAICDQMVGYNCRKVVNVKAVFTRQRCNQGGSTSAENRTTLRGFMCMSCGHADHADLNAFANILASGDWGNCTARSVRVTNPFDPRNGYKSCRVMGTHVHNSLLNFSCSEASPGYHRCREWPH